MAIWADKNTRVIVQGITGKEGTFHAIQCRDYGTQIVGGISPGIEKWKHKLDEAKEQETFPVKA